LLSHAIPNLLHKFHEGLAAGTKKSHGRFVTTYAPNKLTVFPLYQGKNSVSNPPKMAGSTLVNENWLKVIWLKLFVLTVLAKLSDPSWPLQ